MMKYVRSCLTLLLSLTACASMPVTPVPTVPHVELSRFMGSWYVIASIPTFLEKNAYGAVEAYRLDPDGTIATTFSFHKGSLDGPLKTLRPHGRVRDPSNATWDMQFIWPIKAEYRIAYLDAKYSETIIARSKRDYVWIMARTPQLAPRDYEHLVELVAGLGYDTTKLRRVPQAVP